MQPMLAEIRVGSDPAGHSRTGIGRSCPECMDRLLVASEGMLSEVADMYPAC